MDRISFALFIAVFYLSVCLGGNMRYYSQELKEYEELRLSIALDYCTDAAADIMLDTDDLGTDYKELGNIKVNPQIALETFVELFMMNYDMAMTEENKEYVENNFMPVFCVAGYDGYYVASHSKAYEDSHGSSYDLAFGPKLPYTYKPKGSSAYYGLNMGAVNCLKIEENIMSTVSGRPPGLNSKDEVIKVINSTLTDAISHAILEENDGDGVWSNTFFLPSNLTTYTGVQPVTGPSVLAMVQNVDLTTGKKVSAFSIAGSRVNLERMVAGYSRNGQLYYSYVDKLPPGVTKDNALDMFTNTTDAARAGYRCDVQYIE